MEKGRHPPYFYLLVCGPFIMPLPLLTCAVAILDAGRNALSFFLLLVVSLGLSVVRESLGSLLLRCQALAAAHFVFGGTCLVIITFAVADLAFFFCLSLIV